MASTLTAAAAEVDSSYTVPAHTVADVHLHGQPPLDIVATTYVAPIDDDGDEHPTDSAEEKRLKRMRRNRESAAQSRNRKKQYVDSLESEIRQLKGTINSLTSENYELRREHARLTGAPPPVAPEAIAVIAPVNPEDGDPDPQYGAGGAVPPIATAVAADVIVSNPHQPHAAPSPRASDALIGLELLSRSASINGTDKDGDAKADHEPAEVMEADAVVAVGEVKANEHGSIPASHSGSSASSMVMGK